MLRMSNLPTSSLAKSQAVHPMTPAARTEKLLGFKRGFSHNYTQAPVASKVVKVASSHFATA